MTDENELIATAIFEMGDRVIYIPMHAFDDRGHPDCERGCVSSIDGNGNVFVRFDGAVGRHGWAGATAENCSPETLVHERSR